jgi:tetratricopeptide (TPR) repeat protein
MNGLQKFLSWIGLDDTPIQPTRNDPNGIYALLETGQRAKRAESYDAALEALNRATQLAETAHDYTALAVSALHKSEIYVQQKRWEEAEQLLLNMRHNAQNLGQRTQLAYALNVLGTLAQARGDWTEARAYYEQALKVAHNAAALGGEGRAQGHLADTYLQEDNASYAVHLLRESLPKLNTSGDVEMSSYFVGLLGRGMILSGQEIEGERLIHRALRLAEQMHYRRFERMWSLELGDRALAATRYDEALKYYDRALPLLADGTDEKIRAFSSLSKSHLYRQEPDQALVYARQAADAAEILGDTPLITLSQASLGMALRASGQSVRAIEMLEKAAAGYSDAENRTLLIEVLRNLAAAQADVADDEAAIATYGKALEHAKAIDVPLELAQTHLELGLLYSQRKQMQSAIQEWLAALAIYEPLRHYAQVARLYCDIANARKYMGQGQRAMKDFEQALMLLSSIDDWSTRGTVLSNAANAYTDHGDIESADAFFTESISIAAKTGNRAAEATRQGNYGWFLLATGRPQQAVMVLENAIRISQEQKLALQVAVQTDNLGLAHRAMGHDSAALTYQEQAIELVQRQGEPHWQAVISTNYAETFLEIGRVEEAAPLLAQALEWGRANNDLEVIIRALTAQAKLALKRGEIEAAGEMLKQASAYARKADMRRLLAEALHVHSQQKAAVDHFDEARALWDEARKLFTILHIPRLQPEWLKSAPVESN